MMQRRWRSTLAGSAMVALAATAFTGCSLNGGGGGDGGEQIELTLWTHEFAPLQDSMQKKWIPEFEKANPNIKIKLTSVPLAGAVSYDSKLLSTLSSGAGPDVWDMGSWNFPNFQEQGLLAPIDPAAFGYDDDTDLVGAYDPASLKELSYDDKLYGMFSEFDTLATYYNTDVFAEAGIPELPADKPVSWEEIGEIGSKLHQEEGGAVTRTGYQFGFFANFKDAQWYSQNFYTLLRQYGQDDVYVDGKPAGDTEAVRSTLQLFSDFVYKYKAYDPTFLNNWFADVPDGRAAMVSAGTWYAGAALANNPDFKFKVVPNPVVDPDNPDTYKDISYFWGWAVNSHADDAHQAAAQKFLAFILGKKGETAQADYWFNELGYLQPSTAYLESDEFAAAIEKAPYLQTFIDALSNYQVSPPQHVYDEAGAAIVAAIDAVIYDHATPEDAAAELQAALERIDG